MSKHVMICGIDCHEGDRNCNGYCRDRSIPSPGIATEQIVLARLKKQALDKLHEAEKAMYEYFAACPVGAERVRASDIYDNIRTATRV